MTIRKFPAIILRLILTNSAAFNPNTDRSRKFAFGPGHQQGQNFEISPVSLTAVAQGRADMPRPKMRMYSDDEVDCSLLSAEEDRLTWLEEAQSTSSSPPNPHSS
jgi:hypothetical protein